MTLTLMLSLGLTRTWIRLVLVPLLAAAALGAIWLARGRDRTKRAAPSPAAAEPAAPPDDPVVATVGGEPIRRSDVRRFTAARAVFVPGYGEEQGLLDRIDRDLLLRAAAEQRIALAPDERAAALERRRLVGIALASAATPGPRAGAAAPLPDPYAAFLDRRSITEAELLAEVESDLVAEKVKAAMVYERVDVRDEDVERELAAAGGADDLRPLVRRRIARARGARRLVAYLDSLRARWPVDVRSRR
jgi:hypothetical protein